MRESSSWSFQASLQFASVNSTTMWWFMLPHKRFSKNLWSLRVFGEQPKVSIYIFKSTYTIYSFLNTDSKYLFSWANLLSAMKIPAWKVYHPKKKHTFNLDILCQSMSKRIFQHIKTKQFSSWTWHCLCFFCYVLHAAYTNHIEWTKKSGIYEKLPLLLRFTF